ncbi:Uncharacterised protein [Escherichia coli]|nr:Uncharacterised protein [Escherichia coli]
MISRENNKNNLFRVKSKNGVLRCLKAGMDINMCNSKGQTALFTCNVNSLQVWFSIALSQDLTTKSRLILSVAT